MSSHEEGLEEIVHLPVGYVRRDRSPVVPWPAVDAQAVRGFGWRVVKRATDVGISLLLLLLLSPIMLMVALAIKLDDGGTVIYRQTR
ncbi:MAG: sugar transferase, partial [Alicyclobacillus herbarius]|uniref:sugar transferase n=1 Tax=Alicyclobacillus herbarius TaxID=122960 RepID=UPI0023544DD0